MLREICIFLLVPVCGAAGFGRGRAEAGRIRELKRLRRMAQLLAGAISYGGTPLPAALRSVGRRMEEPYGPFLLETAGELERLPGRGFGEIFGEKADRCLRGSGLKKEDLEELKGLGRDLGYLDKQMQLQTIDTCRTEWEQKIGELQEGLPVRRKLYQSLGIMGGLFLAVLLL